MARKHFRTSAAHRKIAQDIYRGLFAGSPNCYLILTPDLQIINGNDSFVSVSRIERDVFAGRYMFDAFPENPDPANTGVKNLMQSFDRVLRTQCTDTLKFQRYDVQNDRGIWEDRRWHGTSWAVTDDKKAITGIILQVTEITHDEVSRLLHEAHVQVQKSQQLLANGHRIAEELEKVANDIQRGRLDSMQTLREMLADFRLKTIH